MQGYQLKIQMKGSTPPVWRRVEVPISLTFDQLHDTIQTLFGWLDYHMFRFHMPFCKTNVQHDVDDYDLLFTDYTFIDTLECLADHFVIGKKISYIYDFGDNWTHDITIEKMIEMETNYPVLVKWKGDNFAEDTGNTVGYYNLLAIVSNPRHKEYAVTKTWLEEQHIPFVEEEVQEELTAIEAELAYIPPILKEDTSNALATACKQLKKEIVKKKVNNFCVIIIERNDQKVVLACRINTDINAYFIQIYENETDFRYGFEHSMEHLNHNPFDFGFQLLMEDQRFPSFNSWSCMNQTCAIRKAHPGYFAISIDQEEAERILQYLQDLIYIMKNTKKDLPSIDMMNVLHAHMDQENKPLLTMEDLPAFPDLPDYVPSEEMMRSLKNLKKHVKDIKIDLLCNPNSDCDSNHKADMLLLLENKSIQHMEELPHDDITSLYDMKVLILDTLTRFMLQHGKLKKILVNNDNMFYILQAYCEKLHILLEEREFRTSLQVMLDELLEDEENELLEYLERLNGEDLQDFLEHLDEDELESFSYYLDHYLQDVDEEFTNPEKPRRIFDA